MSVILFPFSHKVCSSVRCSIFSIFEMQLPYKYSFSSFVSCFKPSIFWKLDIKAQETRWNWNWLQSQRVFFFFFFFFFFFLQNMQGKYSECCASSSSSHLELFFFFFFFVLSHNRLILMSRKLETMDEEIKQAQQRSCTTRCCHFQLNVKSCKETFNWHSHIHSSRSCGQLFNPTSVVIPCPITVKICANKASKRTNVLECWANQHKEAWPRLGAISAEGKRAFTENENEEPGCSGTTRIPTKESTAKLFQHNVDALAF